MPACQCFQIDIYLYFDNYYHFWQRITVASNKRVYKDLVINSELGLHARSAAQIAKIVQKAKANVWIERGPEKADASSIVDILTLACEKGTTITIIIEDPADIGILEAIADLVDSGFGE